MLDNIRRKLSLSNVKVFYNKTYDLGKFEDLIYYEGMIYSISAERGMKKTSDRSFKPFHKSSKDLSLNWVHMKMILCPSGTFIMGPENQEDNKPRPEIIDVSFLLGETEVTQELYQAVMSTNPSEFQNNSQNPVEWVSWFDAILFCNELSKLQGLNECYILTDISTIDEKGVDRERIMSAKVTFEFGKNGYRLPTGKEWEYAAKAGTNSKWAGTDDDDIAKLDKYAVYWNTSKIGEKKQTHPVKSKLPNSWGFYDMGGNVQEWCWDKYDPDNPDTSADRVYRGGGWEDFASSLRSARRYSRSPSYRYYDLGFRVCRSIVN